MRKHFAKTISVVLCLLLMFTAMPVVSFAAEHEYNGKKFTVQTEGDYEYIILSAEALSDYDREIGITAGSVYITKYTGTAPSITIPATLGGKTVEQIGWQAFKGNSAIQTVTVGGTVKGINTDSFMNCIGLQQVLVDKNVVHIHPAAFNGCTGLKTITFHKDSALKQIGYDAFNNCKSLNNLKLPTGLESIGSTAFRNCDSLIELTIPDSVTDLGGAAFFGCDSLREVTIGNGITELKTLGESWGDNWGSDSYYDGTFEGCISLAKVTFGTGLETIGYESFAGCGLTEINIPDNVKTIGNTAFLNCRVNKKTVVGDGVTYIGWSAFENNSAMESVAIGKNVLTIGDIAFRNCDSLKSITIPTSVTELGNAVFFGCDSLETAVIGNGVTELKTRGESWGDNWGSDSYCDGAFEGCVKLKSVTIGSAVRTIGQDCFAGTALPEVVIPDNVITIGAASFQNCRSLTKVVVGNGCTTIGWSAFENNDALTDVTIGRGVVTIGDIAFRDCDALQNIYIPSNVTTLGNAMFFHCNNLEKAVIGNGVTELKTRGESWGDNWGSDSYYDGTFEGCTKLNSVTLGSGIISIGQDSFAGTQIKNLTVPAKVGTLGYAAFAGASQLKDFYFCGNWAASVGGNIFQGVAEEYKVNYISGKVGYDSLSYNTAAFTPVTVTFDNNNDDVFAVITEPQILSPLGGYVIEPISPTALGYLFDGWYKDAACTQKWNFKTDRVTKNTTLYAKWNAVDTVVPVRPENIASAEKDGNSVHLQWTAVDGALSYNIYVDGKKVNDEPVSGTNYLVTGLEASTTYEFEVSAVNTKGESEKSLIFAERTSDHVHTFGDWTVTTPATCITEGVQTHTCTDCGASETETIPATGEHSFGEWTVVTAATCVDKGEERRTCSVCDETETRTVAATGEHSFGSWTVTEKADCDKDGKQTRECAVCGKTETESIPATGEHVYGEWETVKVANCTQSGSERRECTVCGKRETRAVPATGEHVYGEWTVVKAATADAEGLEERFCSVCSTRETRTIDKLNTPGGLLGDMNGDGRVNSADARIALRISARLEKLTDAFLYAGDMNGDNKITSADARTILRIAAKLEPQPQRKH